MTTPITFKRIKEDVVLLNDVRFESELITEDIALELESFSETMFGGFKDGVFFRGKLSFDFATEKVTMILSQKEQGEIGSITLTRKEFNTIQE